MNQPANTINTYGHLKMRKTEKQNLFSHQSSVWSGKILAIVFEQIMSVVSKFDVVAVFFSVIRSCISTFTWPQHDCYRNEFPALHSSVQTCVEKQERPKSKGTTHKHEEVTKSTLNSNSTAFLCQVSLFVSKTTFPDTVQR